MQLPRSIALVAVAAWAAGLAAPSAPARAAEPTEGLTLTHVANAGFLLAAGDTKVLVDALLDEGQPGYGRIPDAVRPALEAGEPPFDGVDLALASHYHLDHFGMRAVERFLVANPEAVFVSTPQAVADLQGLSPDLRERVRSMLPDEGSRAAFEHRGIRVEVFNLHHGRNRRPPVENLGFLLEIGGLTVLHVGDTEASAAELAPYGLPDRGVDLALLPSWFVAWPGWIKATREAIQPRQIAVMHVATDDAPPSYFSNADDYAEMEAKILEEFPEARVFREALDSQIYP